MGIRKKRRIKRERKERKEIAKRERESEELRVFQCDIAVNLRE